LKFTRATFPVVWDQSVSSSSFLCAFASLREFLNVHLCVRILINSTWSDVSDADRLLNNEMIHNVFPTLRRIFAHIKLQERLDCMSVIDRNRGKTHVGSDKMLELRR